MIYDVLTFPVVYFKQIFVIVGENSTLVAFESVGGKLTANIETITHTLLAFFLSPKQQQE